MALGSSPGALLGARTGAALAGVTLALGAATVVAHSATRPAEVPASSVPSDESGRGSAGPEGAAAEAEDRGVGPDAGGPAAFGLCRAWANHEKHDDGTKRAQGSVAMRNLAEAAGGEDKVEGYCATVRHPSAGAKRGGGSDDRDGSGTQAGPKDKVEKQPGKAGRSGKDHPGKGASGKGSKRSGSPSPSPSPSGSPSPSASPSPSGGS